MQETVGCKELMHAIWVTVALLEVEVIRNTQPTATETQQPGERIVAGRQGMTFPQKHK